MQICYHCQTEHRYTRFVKSKHKCNECWKIHNENLRINPSEVSQSATGLKKRNPPTIVDDNGDQWHLAEPEELDVGREILFTKSTFDEQTLAIIEKVNKKSVRVKATMKRGKYPIDRMYTVTFPCVYVWDDDNDNEPTYIKGEVN